MGLKPRKLSTKKTKTKKLKPRNSLSNLPDEILHHILSFLKLRDIARLRVLSKKFQTLSATAPSFCFSERRPSFWFSKPRFSHRRNCSCAHVFNFMNTLPQHRSHSLKIKRISFKSFCDKGKHSSLHDHWINNLFQTFHVEQLSLNYQLPSIFTSLPKFQSLKLLKLEMNRVIMVKLPEMKLASLETLHIMFFKTEDPVGEWVSQSFPALKSLFLSEINVSWLSKKLLDLEIRSSCLEALSIQKCCSLKPVRIITDNLRTLSYVTCPSVRCHHNYKIHYFRYDDSVFEISAPNLRRLSWQGYSPRLCYDARTFQSLQVASFTKLALHNLNLTIQLFDATHRATSLHTDTGMIKDSYGKPSISFGNVRHLEICVKAYFFDRRFWSKKYYDEDVGDDLLTFLEKIPNLETLTIRHDQNPGEYWLREAVRKCRKTNGKKIKGLKKVKFQITSMFDSMAFLIGMLKTRCIHLEEMTLSYPSRYNKSMKLYLNCLESASSTLSINLVSF